MDFLDPLEVLLIDYSYRCEVHVEPAQEITQSLCTLGSFFFLMAYTWPGVLEEVLIDYIIFLVFKHGFDAFSWMRGGGRFD